MSTCGGVLEPGERDWDDAAAQESGAGLTSLAIARSRISLNVLIESRPRIGSFSA